MSETFTKGPWRLDDAIHSGVIGENYHVIDSGRGGWYSLEDGGFSIAAYINLADARLIAAAPDLYEAVIRFLNPPVSLASGTATLDLDKLEEDRAFARAALAKARGET